MYWRAPVLHDALIAAVMCCRHNRRMAFGDRIEQADASFAVFKRMLDMGADVHEQESREVSCVWRLCRTAEDILPVYSWGDHKVSESAVVTPEWRHDLGWIFCCSNSTALIFLMSRLPTIRRRPDILCGNF